MQVALYIYSPETINGSIGITADSTLITADTIDITADNFGSEEINTILSQRVELYNDENISITSSVQDIRDISKAKTDFSQSFTIPASKVNNRIFRHWYESSIDGGFDQRVKYRGYIEIDTIPFRFGGFALNSAKITNNKPESYNITFFGDAKNINDFLKEDKLSSLDFSDLNHEFIPDEVVDRITSNTESVAYPLFAHDRIYNYGGGGSSDVTINAGAIKWNSLFPAVSLATILQKINDKYGISFTGAFVNYVQFSKLWMLFKNAETLVVKTEPLKVNFTSKDDLSNRQVNLTTDEVGFDLIQGTIKLRISIEPSVDTTPYDVLIFKNGILFNAFTGQLGLSSNEFFSGTVNSQNVNDKYTIFVQSDAPFSFTSMLSYFTIAGLSTKRAFGTTQTTVANINIASYAPEMKLIDLVGGLIKMFNLVIIPNNENTFELIPLELYYNNGLIRDISSNLIADDIEIKKTSMYKNINFKYQKSEAILNNKFNELFTPQRGYDYGDLFYEQIDSIESNTFTVDLPFENPIYERKSSSNFQTITFKNKDLNNYVPKPLLMYDNGLQDLTTDIVIETNSHVDISNYRRFSNDIDNGELITINWGEEVSQWSLNVAGEGLYKRHYSNYIGNIFSIKGRLLNVKTKFNPVDLAEIKLNDRIVIRDKKYTINNMSTNLTTGEVTFELLTDYRTIGEIEIGTRYTVNEVYNVDYKEQVVDVLVFTAGALSVTPEASSSDWLLYDLTTQNENFNLTVSVSENETPSPRFGNIVLEYDYAGDFKTINVLVTQEPNPESFIEDGFRTIGSPSDIGICSDTDFVTCKFQLAISGIIQDGDICLNNDETPFDGNDFNYRVYLDSVPTDSYSIVIDDNGVITVNNLC